MLPTRSTVSASIVSRGVSQALYDHDDVPCWGFVVAPAACAVTCSYHADGCSNVKECGAPIPTKESCGLLPGVRPALRAADGTCLSACGPRWCGANDPSQPNLCAHRRLGEMLQAQRACGWCRASHNELILDAGRWARMLPATIEAVVVTRRCRESDRAEARRHRLGFLARYGLDDGQVPVVAYDPQRSGAAPFADVT